MATRRLELGFDGGTVLRLEVDEAVAVELTGSLSGDDAAWREVEGADGTVWIDARRLRYVRLPRREVPDRVGFGGS